MIKLLKAKPKILVSNELLNDFFNILGSPNVAFLGMSSSQNLAPLNDAAEEIVSGIEEIEDLEKYRPRIVAAKLAISNPENDLLSRIHNIWTKRREKSVLYLDKITWIAKDAYDVNLEPTQGKISITREMRDPSALLINLDGLLAKKELCVTKEWPDGDTTYTS